MPNQKERNLRNANWIVNPPQNSLKTMATMTQAPSVVSTDAVDGKEATQALLDHLEAMNVKPLWTQMKRVNPPLPNPSAVPYVWRYDELRPKLIQAGDLVDESQAERRVLMLTNPKKGKVGDFARKALIAELSLDAPCTTDTIFGGLQLVMPNEVAPAHRHTAFAMRFIIEGHGGFTAVNGQRIKMHRGDVILTPSWQWHDHGKDGSGPMIWLDGLDVPSFLHFPVHFVEHFEDPRYPAQDVDKDACPIVFPWAQMREKLDSAMGTWATLPYLDQDGKEGEWLLVNFFISTDRERSEQDTRRVSGENQRGHSFGGQTRNCVEHLPRHRGLWEHAGGGREVDVEER